MQHGPAIREIKVGKVRDGSGQLGSCPTDATREGRRRRVVLKFAAMPTLERLR